MLTGTEWSLIYLCWLITLGSLVATAFTLRRFAVMRRQRLAGMPHGEFDELRILAIFAVAVVAIAALGVGGYDLLIANYPALAWFLSVLTGAIIGALASYFLMEHGPSFMHRIGSWLHK